jgi:hypothetical protein
MQILDLRAQYLPVRNAYTSICNLQSEIINDKRSNTPKQLAIFTSKAIELCPGPRDQVLDVE